MPSDNRHVRTRHLEQFGQEVLDGTVRAVANRRGFDLELERAVVDTPDRVSGSSWLDEGIDQHGASSTG
jgi:hypothetical protein